MLKVDFRLDKLFLKCELSFFFLDISLKFDIVIRTRTSDSSSVVLKFFKSRVRC